MKVLVVGSGAREHALVHRLAADPDVTELHCAPGNPGIAAEATCHPLDAQDGAATAALATMIAIAVYVLVVVARPYNWWKVILLAVSVGAYVLIFTVPLTQRLFHLDSSNLKMMGIAAICALVGCVAVELSTQAMNRYLSKRNGRAEVGAESDAAVVSEHGSQGNR